MKLYKYSPNLYALDVDLTKSVIITPSNCTIDSHTADPSKEIQIDSEIESFVGSVLGTNKSETVFMTYALVSHLTQDPPQS